MKKIFYALFIFRGKGKRPGRKAAGSGNARQAAGNPGRKRIPAWSPAGNSAMTFASGWGAASRYRILFRTSRHAGLPSGHQV
jgi:hypothetical protein